MSAARAVWPWEPIEALLTARLGGRDDGVTAMADLLCCNPPLHRWRACGYMTTTSADRAAIALGLHPALVWPGWYADEPQQAVVA